MESNWPSKPSPKIAVTTTPQSQPDNTFHIGLHGDTWKTWMSNILQINNGVHILRVEQVRDA